MAVLSHYNLNSDYTSVKEVQDFDVTLSSAAKSVNAWGYFTRTLDIPVPAGTYLENVTMTLSSTSETSPAHTMFYLRNYSNGYEQLMATVRKTTASNYQIYCVVNNSSESTRTFPAFTVRVRAHLFVSSL